MLTTWNWPDDPSRLWMAPMGGVTAERCQAQGPDGRSWETIESLQRLTASSQRQLEWPGGRSSSRIPSPKCLRQVCIQGWPAAGASSPGDDAEVQQLSVRDTLPKGEPVSQPFAWGIGAVTPAGVLFSITTWKQRT